MYIYKITNHINSKIYIGKTINIEKRWYKHKYLAEKSKINRHLYNSMRKHGINNFLISVIEECLDDIANEREKYWIKTLNSTDRNIGYNSTIGGDGGNTWELNNHKEETSKKLSKILTGHNVNMESIKILAELRRGTHVSEEQKQKISNTLKEKYASGEIKINIPPHYDRSGEHHTEESKEKMSKYRKGKTYEEIYGEITAENMRKRRSEVWTNKGNPQYKDINIDKIISMIKKGDTNKYIAEYFNITPPTLWYKLKSVGLKATEIRKENIN